ncbi:hypothetical protein DOTSEDRAFT_86492 [Dothistroma septosporum NZE10]|uniref:RING-type domain-containing protein n=1 Tax=Dothistroma septosporum (strain NZE10 / CBS 128990) TaxID=675120 RepID=N1PYW6_DOTSN|nr:hypothetical protein DOTSEDRAFT_86492 [Dothistroma septosporum NZE10]
MALSGTLMRRLQERLDGIFLPMARFVEHCRRTCFRLVRACLDRLPLMALRIMDDIMLYVVTYSAIAPSGTSTLQTRQAFERVLLSTTIDNLDGDCIICKSSHERPVHLTCNHVYCLDCITAWFDMENNRCPQCFHLLFLHESKHKVAALQVQIYAAFAGAVCDCTYVWLCNPLAIYVGVEQTLADILIQSLVTLVRVYLMMDVCGLYLAGRRVSGLEWWKELSLGRTTDRAGAIFLTVLATWSFVALCCGVQDVVTILLRAP